MSNLEKLLKQKEVELELLLQVKEEWNADQSTLRQQLIDCQNSRQSLHNEMEQCGARLRQTLEALDNVHDANRSLSDEKRTLGERIDELGALPVAPTPFYHSMKPRRTHMPLYTQFDCMKKPRHRRLKANSRWRRRLKALQRQQGRS